MSQAVIPLPFTILMLHDEASEKYALSWKAQLSHIGSPTKIGLLLIRFAHVVMNPTRITDRPLFRVMYSP